MAAPRVTRLIGVILRILGLRGLVPGGRTSGGPHDTRPRFSRAVPANARSARAIETSDGIAINKSAMGQIILVGVSLASLTGDWLVVA
jgi:hypothetical protein